MPFPTDPRAFEQAFNTAHAEYLTGDKANYETRIVLARDIQVPEGFEPLPGRLAQMRSGFQTERRLWESPSAAPIAVLEREDGSLWTFENVPMLTLFHEMASLARLKVVILATERPRPEKPAAFRHAPRR